MKKDFLIENIENLTPREKEILEKLFKNSEDVDLVEVMNQQLSEEWIEKEGKEEISGKNFGFENLKYNSLKFGKFIFNNRFQPWLFSILFILGAIYMGYKQGKEFLFLLGWFVLLWFIYFFSWFQTLGGGTLLRGKKRFFMSFYPITVFFAGYGMLWIKNIIPRKIRKINLKKYIIPVITVILTLFFIPYSLEVKDMFSDDQQKLETKIPELAEKDIPENCVIVAN